MQLMYIMKSIKPEKESRYRCFIPVIFPHCLIRANRKSNQYVSSIQRQELQFDYSKAVKGFQFYAMGLFYEISSCKQDRYFGTRYFS